MIFVFFDCLYVLLLLSSANLFVQKNIHFQKISKVS